MILKQQFEPAYFRKSIISRFLLLAPILATLSSVNASCLRIEDETDFDRVANNVISFWNVHEDAIELVAKNKLKSSEGIVVLEKIRLSKTGIAKDFSANRKEMSKDLENTFQYVKNNSANVISKLNEEKYEEFYNGLVLLKRLTKYIR